MSETSVTADTSEAADVTQRIAARVRALRAERGLSIEALASACDVSRSAISLIERGESSPTAVVLDKLATGLGVALADLFADAAPEAAPQPLARRASQPIWRDPDSGYVRRGISPTGHPSPIQIVEVDFPPGARVAYETGARAAVIHQQVWVLEGRIDLTVGEDRHRLEAGDCLAMRLDRPTVFHNPTRKPAHYVVVLCTESGPRK